MMIRSRRHHRVFEIRRAIYIILELRYKSSQNRNDYSSSTSIYIRFYEGLKKNLDASRPFEHDPVRGKKYQNV